LWKLRLKKTIAGRGWGGGIKRVDSQRRARLGVLRLKGKAGGARLTGDGRRRWGRDVPFSIRWAGLGTNSDEIYPLPDYP